MTAEEHRILRVYHSATPAEIADGVSWYPRARAFAVELAERYDVTVEIAAGIVATLSPSVTWERNQEDADTTLAAFRRNVWAHHKRFPKVGAYGLKDRSKCQGIFERGGEPTGVKVNAFYHCILNPLGDHVVIDRHALSIVMGERQEMSLTPKQYELTANHYRSVARVMGLIPSRLQAITWVIWRERMEEFL